MHFLFIKSKLRITSYAMIGCVLVVLFCTSFVFSICRVTSESMYPALRTGNFIIANKLSLGPRIYNSFTSGDWIYRIKGYGSVCRNDIVLFNYPYEKWNEWDKITFNKRKYYVKRCIAIPGDSIIIKNGKYEILGIKQFVGNLQMQSELSYHIESNSRLFYTLPYDSILKWNIIDFGPLYIPKKDVVISFDYKNYILYKKIVEWETGKRLEYIHGYFVLDDKKINEYVFKHNYYFMAGDNVFQSLDSRYWGLVPDDFLIGKVIAII